MVAIQVCEGLIEVAR